VNFVSFDYWRRVLPGLLVAVVPQLSMAVCRTDGSTSGSRRLNVVSPCPVFTRSPLIGPSKVDVRLLGELRGDRIFSSVTFHSSLSVRCGSCTALNAA